jgi:hypothetical protein
MTTSTRSCAFSFPKTPDALRAGCAFPLCYSDDKLRALLAVAHSKEGVLQALLAVPRVDATYLVTGLLATYDRKEALHWAAMAVSRADQYAALGLGYSHYCAAEAKLDAAPAHPYNDLAFYINSAVRHAYDAADVNGLGASEHRVALRHALYLLGLFS